CVDGLGSHLGPILFQLPPHWELNLERLRSFLKALPKRRKCAFEFRNSSWLVEEVYDLLREYGIGFCIYDLNGFTTDPIVTTDFVYVRLHGPKAAYKDKYPLSSLKKWSRFFDEQIQQGKDVYCYFNNDEAAYAVANAKTLNSLCARKMKHAA
ncbi:MAG: DUF72 domain-containing protein, partial [Chlamydiales bacterium]